MVWLCTIYQSEQNSTVAQTYIYIIFVAHFAARVLMFLRTFIHFFHRVPCSSFHVYLFSKIYFSFWHSRGCEVNIFSLFARASKRLDDDQPTDPPFLASTWFVCNSASYLFWATHKMQCLCRFICIWSQLEFNCIYFSLAQLKNEQFIRAMKLCCMRYLFFFRSFFFFW